MSNENSYKCLLPDGRNVELFSAEGANAFIQATQVAGQVFSPKIKTANDIRQKDSLDYQDKFQLKALYIMLGVVSENATPNIFEEIPKSEIECWYEHSIEMLQVFTNDSQWKQTGALEEHDACVINTCISLSEHVNAVRIALKKDFYKVLANFIAAREAPLLPCADIAESIVFIVQNSRNTLTHPSKNSKQTWSSEKFWKKIESSGLLLQFIRCSTIPQHIQDPSVYMCYDDLLTCLPLLGKKFKEGEPCGDVIQAILKGTDGSKKKNQRIITYIRNLARMGDTFQSRSQPDAGITSMQMCRNCNKHALATEPQKSLLVCARCKQTYYCSRECQKQDWKSHKLLCIAVDDKKVAKTKNTKTNGVMKFAQDNYLEILDEIISTMTETGLSKEDLLLEMSFVTDESGCAPALKTPAEFNIKDARGYFEGTRPNEPDWFFKQEDPEVYEANIASILPDLKDQYGRMTPNHLLCLARFPESCMAFRLSLCTPQKHSEMFASATIEAYRKALEEGNFGPMSHIFDVDQMQGLRPLITSKRLQSMDPFSMLSGSENPSSMLGGGNEPSIEDKMDTVRMMLNAFGADFELRGSG